MQWLLVVSGCIVLVACLAMVIVPYLRGSADLLTTWSLFLLGVANFVGISAIQSGLAENHLYGIFDTSEYWRFALGSIIFLIAVSLTYYKFAWPRRAAHRRMRKWPPMTAAAMCGAIVLCALLTFAGVQAPNVQFVGQILIFFGLVASNYAAAFGFYIWDERRWNPAAIALLGGTLAMGLVAAIGRGSGRIYLLTMLLTVPFCWYWKTLRYKPARSMILPMSVGLVVTVFLIGGYSAVRHARRDPNAGLAELAIARLKAIPEGFQKGKSVILGGDTTDVSLLAIQRYTQVADPEPFATVIYVLSNPIPRAWWPGKIGALGETLPKEAGIWSRFGYVSLGPGIIGHGYHEGGLHMIVFYGLFIGSALRFIDELLVTRSHNPFIVGMIASVGGFFFALPRGELGLYMIHIIAGFLTAFILNLICRLIFGTVDDGTIAYDEPVHEEHLHAAEPEYPAWH